MKKIVVGAGFLIVAGLLAYGTVRIGALNPSLETLRAKYAGPPSQFITVDGVPFHVRDEGQGPPPILPNGHLGNLHLFDGWVPVLTPHTRLIRIDCPPYGLSGSDPTGDYPSERSVKLLGQLIDQLGLTKVSVGDIVRDQLKNAPLIMKRYPDGGHMTMLELPQQMAEDVLRFMQQPIAKTE